MKPRSTYAERHAMPWYRKTLTILYENWWWYLILGCIFYILGHLSR